MLKELTVREGRDYAVDYPAATGAQCLRDITRRRRHYICTREPDHRDVHVAHLPDGSGIAVWDEEDGA